MGPGDPGLDPAAMQRPARRARVVGAIAIDARRSSLGPSAAAADRRHGVEERDEAGDVVDVGGGGLRGERVAAPAAQDVVLRAALSAVHRARAGLIAPPTARTWEESIAARCQSICSAAWSLESSTSCSRSHTRSEERRV